MPKAFATGFVGQPAVHKLDAPFTVCYRQSTWCGRVIERIQPRSHLSRDIGQLQVLNIALTLVIDDDESVVVPFRQPVVHELFDIPLSSHPTCVVDLIEHHCSLDDCLESVPRDQQVRRESVFDASWNGWLKADCKAHVTECLMNIEMPKYGVNLLSLLGL